MEDGRTGLFRGTHNFIPRVRDLGNTKDYLSKLGLSVPLEHAGQLLVVQSNALAD